MLLDFVIKLFFDIVDYRLKEDWLKWKELSVDKSLVVSQRTMLSVEGFLLTFLDTENRHFATSLLPPDGFVVF